MKTEQRTIDVKIADDVKHAIAWCETEYPHGIDLVYVDYRDSYSDNLEALARLLRDGSILDADSDWIATAQRDTVDSVVDEYKKVTEADELTEEVCDAIMDWCYEHDTSTPELDLLRNTRDQLFFIETPDTFTKDDNIVDGFYVGSDLNTEELAQKYAKTDAQREDIKYVCDNSFYSAPVSFYFSLSPLDVYNVLHGKDADNKYIQIDGAYFATVDRVQGSNWIGDKGMFTLTISREDFMKDVYLDKAKGNGYSWDSIAGQTHFDNAGIAPTDNVRADSVLLSTVTSPELAREQVLAQRWNNTKKCTAGDTNISRHPSDKTEYRNDYPCGTTCRACGTFWID